MIVNNWSDLKRVRTNHLYQIYAYASQIKFEGAVISLLLYPTITEEVNELFPLDKEIRIKTINLNSEWKFIYV